jgi:hypothetical protein
VARRPEEAQAVVRGGIHDLGRLVFWEGFGRIDQSAVRSREAFGPTTRVDMGMRAFGKVPTSSISTSWKARKPAAAGMTVRRVF